MRSGITLNPDGPLQDVIGAVRLADELGFRDCYVADQGFSRDVYVVLSALAGATERIQLGPGVTHPYTRHPATTAVAIATLDEASRGRAFLGLGAGGSRTLDPLCTARVAPLAACREAVTIARLLWSGAVVDHDGERFPLRGARLRVACRSVIELHWAARGARMLALGGELADVVMLHGIPRFEVANAVSHIRRGASLAHREVEIQFVTPLVFDESSREAARMRTVYRIVDSPEHVQRELGLSPEQCAIMRSLVASAGPAAAATLVSDDVLDHFVLAPDAAASVSELGALFSANGLTGLTIEISELDRASAVLPRGAALINALTRQTERPSRPAP